jgi:hypothetical protein
MKIVLILPVLLSLMGCVTNVYDKNQEGQTNCVTATSTKDISTNPLP